MGTAAAAEYDEITVGRGETFTVRVNSGETFENKLIDISAPGATFDIEASGSDWVVRNIGIKGVWDQYEKAEPFRARVDAGGTGLIENYYFADGCPDDTYAGVTGIYVYRTHAGDLTINRTNIQDLPDNAIYASTPGYPEETVGNRYPGNQGTVVIKNSYAEGCRASHFRVGTTGSRIENCVAVGGDQGDRGVWARFNDIEVVGCSLTGHAQGDIACGTYEWPDGADATVTPTDTYFETTDDTLTYRGTVRAGSSGSPTKALPDGAPTSAEEAASGGPTIDSTTDSSDTTTDVTDAPDLANTLTVETVEGGPLVEYEFTVDGQVAKGSDAESSDTLASSDGTTTVTGKTGNGYADDYEFDGELTAFSANVDADNYTVLVNGEELSFEQTSMLTVETAEGGPLVEYRFTVDGEVTRGADAESSDSVSSNDDGTTTVTGKTGNGYADDYEFEGELLDFSANVAADDYTVLVDGEEIEVQSTNTLTVETTEGGPLVRYEFTVNGTATRGPESEGSEKVTSNGDGTTTVTGKTGNGYVDDFEFVGWLTDFSADVAADNYRVLVNGEEVDTA
ncbi:hypothetical protein ACFQJC_17945 [Haloferax namakaokahaiae]|uniref:Right handed beta helix region n=1 Tax=Haloferax namakaokahaiae TaxID=1748331 RepID=A0ABD5ZJK5_9EURY